MRSRGFERVDPPPHASRRAERRHSPRYAAERSMRHAGDMIAGLLEEVRRGCRSPRWRPGAKPCHALLGLCGRSPRHLIVSGAVGTRDRFVCSRPFDAPRFQLSRVCRAVELSSDASGADTAHHYEGHCGAIWEKRWGSRGYLGHTVYRMCVCVCECR